MAKLVSYASRIRKSVNWVELGVNSRKISYELLAEVEWEKIRELHILGSVERIDELATILEEGIPADRNGCYISADKSWMLILGAPVGYIKEYVLKCSEELKTLDIRFTGIASLDLSKVTKLKRLELGSNRNLRTILGLENLHELHVMSLNHTLIDGEIDISHMLGLYSLSIRDTLISAISLNTDLHAINFLDIANTLITNAQFIEKMSPLVRINISGTSILSLPSLSHCKNLDALIISHTPISSLPDIISLRNLRTLNIGDTSIVDLSGVEFPTSIRGLILSGTGIRVLPDSIGKLKNLQRLNLANMDLDMLPLWLAKLKLEFVFDEKIARGINLYNTQIKGVNMEIFSQPRSVVEAWLKAQETSDLSTPELSESKVIFLGDGGAGKSLTIQRILSDGQELCDFSGDSTPGISITTKEIDVGNKEVQVHFWDFGGQEILHSMHRMFLTRRTLYVVLINARDNTQDERARYWLHNIKSFANGSPVLLVLNQIDQNPSASVNEVSLRKLYPHLTKIIKLSAKEYTRSEFRNCFETALIEDISHMPSISEPFLPSWSILKAKLQNMSENYIDAEMYLRLSNECGIEDNDEIRDGLLGWFGDLGVSFCYRDSSVLSNFMVLRPDWITNAIYLILFNSAGKVSNGLIKHEVIHELLHPAKKGGPHPKSVLSDVTYTTTEIEYVLGVIRKFRLSYRIDDDTEFIPMLCDRNEKPEASSFVQENGVLEYHMNYSYLPNNVLHRLMVEMRSNLDVNNVWLTGALFEEKEMGLRALVKDEDNVLKIYVTSTNTLHPANTYLSILKSTVARINKDLGLEAEEEIVYKQDGKEEVFDYNYIVESYQHGNTDVYSSKFKKNLKILDILYQSDRSVSENKRDLIEAIISACKTMQGNKIYWKASEDERNTQIRDILRAKGYIIADQTFSGKSASGIKAGELDIQILESTDKAWTVYEALNISGFSQSEKDKWNEHLNRLLDNYNPIGYPFLFLVSYLECSKDKVREMWLKYSNHLSSYSPQNYSLQSFSNRNSDSSFIWSAECVYDRAGLPTTVYHICVRLGD